MKLRILQMLYNKSLHTPPDASVTCELKRYKP